MIDTFLAAATVLEDTKSSGRTFRALMRRSRGGRRRWRLGLAAALVVSAACDAQPEANNAPPTTVGATPATTVTTAAPELTSTSTAPTTTTIPADPIASWSQALAGSTLSAGPTLLANPPAGVRSDGQRAELLTWDGQVWNVAYPLEFRQAPDLVEALTMVDVTGDGIEDIVASIWLGQDVYGDVFVFDGHRYSAADVDNSANPTLAPGEIPNPQLSGTSLVGLAETCEPDCATGGLLTVNYAWSGNRLRSSPGVCTDYRAIPEYTDMAVCTKGGTIAELQEALSYFGYMRGRADGYFGLGTRAGLVAYQREVGQFESGWITIGDAIALIEYYHQSASGDW